MLLKCSGNRVQFKRCSTTIINNVFHKFCVNMDMKWQTIYLYKLHKHQMILQLNEARIQILFIISFENLIHLHTLPDSTLNCNLVVQLRQSPVSPEAVPLWHPLLQLLSNIQQDFPGYHSNDQLTNKSAVVKLSKYRAACIFIDSSNPVFLFHYYLIAKI